MADFPSVTQVLKPFADFSKIPEDILLLASERGTAVHDACAAILLDIPFSIPPEFQGYVDSFFYWKEKMVDSEIKIDRMVRFVERRFTDERFGFCGKPDFVGKLKGVHGPSVVDWKTPLLVSQTWKAQVAAYKHLTGAASGGTLRLDKNGGPARMDWFDDDPCAFPAFLNALNAWRYFK